MKQFIAILFLLLPLINKAQDVEQSLSAQSFNREGGTMIINYVIPKSDIPVNLQYDLKDIFFVNQGTTYRATTVTGTTQLLTAGKQVIYWEVGRDAPSAFDISEIEVVIRYDNDTYNRVMDWKRHQEELERQKNQPKPQPEVQPTVAKVITPPVEPKKTVEKKRWRRKFRRTQFGVLASLGTGVFKFNSGSALESKLASADISWQAGAVLRTHVTNWLGIQVGAVYANCKYVINSPVVDEQKNSKYIGLKTVDVPISLHWNWGSNFNLFAGYNYQTRLEGYTFEEGNTEIVKLDKDVYLKNGAGWFYGAEIRGRHYGLSVKYQMNEQNTWSKNFTDILAKETFPNRRIDMSKEKMYAGAWWLTYALYF